MEEDGDERDERAPPPELEEPPEDEPDDPEDEEPDDDDPEEELDDELEELFAPLPREPVRAKLFTSSCSRE